MKAVLQNPAAENFAKLVSPIIASVFAVYLTIGLTLGTLPVLISQDLGFDSLVVGLVIGLQALATLLTRAYAGKLTDTRGAKKSNHSGIVFIMLAGAMYAGAVLFSKKPLTALVFILLARIVHGIAESLAITGALTWGIGLVGIQKSGRVMTWNGIAMYAGIAVGAPVAMWVKRNAGTADVFALVVLLSVLSWLCTVKLPALAPDPARVRAPFYTVIGLIAPQGVGLAFSSIAFACISSFISLFFAANTWPHSSTAFMLFGTCYILTRVFFSSFPDRFGGYRVAICSLLVEAAGQLFIALAATEHMALAGCALTGVGFSLIFPSLGVLAIKKVDAGMRGTALGAYAAFFDLSLGIAGPAAGVIAGQFHYQAIYFFGAFSCVIALMVIVLKKNG
jgi:MFS family permease